MFVPRADGKVNLDDPAGEIEILLGGCYTILIQRSFNQSGEDVNLLAEKHHFHVNVELWRYES